MGYGKDRKRRVKANPELHLMSFEAEMSREKGKAKKLRDTAWWRKKCAAGICAYCGKKIPRGELTMDHVIPLSRGGKSERFNIVPACKDCNNKKKYLLPAEWDEYLNKISEKSITGKIDESE